MSPRGRVSSSEGVAMKSRPEYDPRIIGENLRRLRKSKSLSVEEVKEYLRFSSVQAIYKYEEGKGYPQVDTMFALMELYEASLTDIVCKHNDELCSYCEESRVPFSVICVYSALDNDIFLEVIFVAYEGGRKQRTRLKNYYQLYVGYIGKGIVNSR